MDFKKNGGDACFITHYTFSIKENNQENDEENGEEHLDPFEKLIKVLRYIVVELKHCLGSPDEPFISNVQSSLSNMHLLVVGGDPSASKSIHNALLFLNRNFDFHIDSSVKFES